MQKTIKINEEVYEVGYIYDLIDNWVKNGELVEVRKGEFFRTRKHFVRSILGLSKIVPFPGKINMYLLSLKIQFTDIYEEWMGLKYPNSLITH